MTAPKFSHIHAVSLRNIVVDTGPVPVQPARRNLARRHSLLRALDRPADPVSLVLETRRRLVDVFVLLHVGEKVLYVSEVVAESLSPDFGPMVLPQVPGSRFVVKVWVKQPDWFLHAEYTVDLAAWVAVDDDEDLFSDNSVVVHLDGPHSHPLFLKKRPRGHRGSMRSALAALYLFDTIRLLVRLDGALHELRRANAKLARSIHENVQKLNHPSYTDTARFAISLKHLTKAILRQRALNDSVMSAIASTKVRIGQLHQITSEDWPMVEDLARNKIDLVESQIGPVTDTLGELFPQIRALLRSHCLLLREAFAIDTTPSHRFTILGLEFPSTFKDLFSLCYYDDVVLANTNVDLPLESYSTPNHVNGALALIVQLLVHLQHLTGANFKYPITFGAQPYIQDPVSGTKYPLFFDPATVERLGTDYSYTPKRPILKAPPFEQAIALLNKNLVLLIGRVTHLYETFGSNQQLSNNIPIDCLDSFLWNLQYVMLFMTAEPEPA